VTDDFVFVTDVKDAWRDGANASAVDATSASNTAMARRDGTMLFAEQSRIRTSQLVVTTKAAR